MSDEKTERKRKISKTAALKRTQTVVKDLAPPSIARYIYDRSPLFDEKKSFCVRFMYLVKYAIIIALIVFCVKYIYLSIYEYLYDEPFGSNLEFRHNTELALPGITLCRAFGAVPGFKDCQVTRKCFYFGG